jgi:hypothetical protein
MTMDIKELAIQSRVPVFLTDDLFYGDGVRDSTKGVIREIKQAYEKFQKAVARHEDIVTKQDESSAAAQTALDNSETAFGLFKRAVEKNRGELTEDQLAVYHGIITSAPFNVPDAPESPA